MSNTNRDYLVVNTVKDSTISIKRALKFVNTDRNTSNIFIRLVNEIEVDENIKDYVDIEDAENYSVSMRVIKPNNELKTIGATLLVEENLFRIDLPQDFTDIVGTYACELVVRTEVDGVEEINTSNEFSYTVRASIVNKAGTVTQADTLVQQLITRIEALENKLK